MTAVFPSAASESQAGHWMRSPWIWVLGCFLVSRLILQAVGIMARWGWEAFMLDHFHWFSSVASWLDVWSAWDSGWYFNIIQHGYDTSVTHVNPDGTPRQLNFAFFPLYPLLVWLLSKATGNPLLAGVLLSNACFLASLRLLYAVGKPRWGDDAARAAVAILCFMPHSFIFSAVYTESLFLMLLLGCVLAADRQQWFLAGVLGAFLAATRLVGITVGLGLLWIFLEQRRAAGILDWRPRRADLRVLWLGLIPLGIVAFAVYLHFHAGDAFAFMKAQRGWYRVWHFPLVAIGKSLYFATPENVYLAIATCLHLALAACVVLLRRWDEVLLALPLMLVPLLSGPGDVPLASMPRYFLVVFPLVGVMAYVYRRAPTVAGLCFLLMALWNGFLMTAWATGLHIVI
ncbi:mannosyltransferase family protein [Megalodesulfovibrio gigas]|uniref:Glycosyltransferase RgtA/B/C/D-like domain-containing protein n=1 Tax=Megalodesulfovibrio gigas (strain ATCC 19364 / DSM 1382 / NCIMB 9332 / VKM B-1759) TaxID=1121448 RepID=T2GEQ3_MEGG1|nr:mannosyltransferase family protein [Megalodesulfovibrio gigas]AGW14644.1 hypothetical protein DGI_2918 [Megalodesulfovibrio gigas DSM 1382 = ATCC 19364]